MSCRYQNVGVRPDLLTHVRMGLLVFFTRQNTQSISCSTPERGRYLLKPVAQRHDLACSLALLHRDVLYAAVRTQLSPVAITFAGVVFT